MDLPDTIDSFADLQTDTVKHVDTDTGICHAGATMDVVNSENAEKGPQIETSDLTMEIANINSICHTGATADGVNSENTEKGPHTETSDLTMETANINGDKEAVDLRLELITGHSEGTDPELEINTTEFCETNSVHVRGATQKFVDTATVLESGRPIVQGDSDIANIGKRNKTNMNEDMDKTKPHRTSSPIQGFEGLNIANVSNVDLDIEVPVIDHSDGRQHSFVDKEEPSVKSSVTYDYVETKNKTLNGVYKQKTSVKSGAVHDKVETKNKRKNVDINQQSTSASSSIAHGHMKTGTKTEHLVDVNIGKQETTSVKSSVNHEYVGTKNKTEHLVDVGNQDTSVKPSVNHEYVETKNKTENTDDVDGLLHKEDIMEPSLEEEDPIDFDKKLFDSAVESVDCDMCFVGGTVVSPTSYCYTCQIYLCGTCYRHHSRIATTSHHSVVHKNDLVRNVYKQPTTFLGDTSKATALNMPKEIKHPDKPIRTNRNLVEPGRYASEYVRDKDTVCAPCKMEGRKEPGSAFCVPCSQYLCVKCKTYHTKFEASKDHEVVHKHSMEEKDFKTFVPAYTIPSSPRGHSMFGSTSTVSSKADTQGHDSLVKLKNPKTFSSLIYHDVQTPQVTGVAFMGDGKILVCDRRNKGVKLFSNKLTPLSSLTMDGLADITALNENTAVVSQPDKSMLLYIGFKENSKMFLKRSIETKGSYWGVDSLHGELFALCMADTGSQATIHMLSMQGQVLSVIHPHLGQGYDLQLQNSKYFAVSPAGGTFYISDSILGVVAIGTDGRAIFNCQSPDIERPCGIQADSKNVYVCCPATSSMVTISPDGRHFSEVMSFVEAMLLPNCVALSPDSSQMAVAFLEGETINLYKNFRKT